ncbi:helix-turn-helix domain-containing protein [Streptomyces avermitilis]
MGAWQPLPDDLPPEVRHFVEQLRLLKDRTGLSLVALGARTAYSKSSWQRYLNATQPPPRQAVAALCRVAGVADTEAERFGVRWELAVHAWPRPPAPAPAHAGGPTGEPMGGPTGEPMGGPTGGPMGEPMGGPAPGAYEDDPTLPWWDARDNVPEPRWSPTRLLAVAGVVVVALLLSVLIGAFALT